MKEERPYSGIKINGFAALFLILVLLGLGAWFVSTGLLPLVICGVALGALAFVGCGGFILLQPNESAVLIFFGKYAGTFSEVGFNWVNPLMSSHKLSLRINNLDVTPIKVNDKVGNPIMIGLVLVWKIRDTYKVMFDLNSRGGNSGIVTDFVAVQSDAALREVAGRYAYDDDTTHSHSDSDPITLRSGGEEVNEELERKLNERLAMAGIEVVEARINYLAYAPEIAAVMLRRQQASAIISAREKIVEGAVSMVEMALERLDDSKSLTLSEAEKSRMVGNLLVVLCADEAATPVVPTN